MVFLSLIWIRWQETSCNRLYPLLLAPDPSKRPVRLEDLFTAAEQDEGDDQEWDDASEDTEMVSHTLVAVSPMFSWELPGLPEYLPRQSGSGALPSVPEHN